MVDGLHPDNNDPAYIEERESFKQFYVVCKLRLTYLLMVLCAEQEIVEKTVQEVLHGARQNWRNLRWQDLPEKEVFGKGIALLRTVQANIRREEQEKEHPISRRMPGETWEYPSLPSTEWIELHYDLCCAIGRLKRRPAEVAALHFLLQYPISEIALMLNLSIGTVRKHWQTARDALRHDLASWEP